MGVFSFFKMDSGRIASPVPADKVNRTYKSLRMQSFLAGTFGYALYYVCRLSMGVMKQPLIDAGLLNATQLGIIGACLYWAYAIGKLINGFLADSSNIKRFMAAGLTVSVLMNFIMGILGVSASMGMIGNATLFVLFAVCWAVNGWSQSMGAPPAIIALSRWFPLRVRGTFYGFFSASHNIGEGLSFVFVGALVGAAGWKWGFFGAALAGVLGIAIILLFLHNSTESKGLPSIETLSGEPQPKEVPASEKRSETRRLQKMVVKNPGVWILAIASAFMYMSRYAINEWGTFFLQDAKGYDLTEAAFIIGINPIFGVIGTVVSGWLSDFVFKGDRKYPAFVAGILEAIALGIFLFGGKAAWVNIVAMVLFGIAIGVLISFLGGLMAIDLVPRKATGAALGIVGMASYAAAGIMTLVTGVMLTSHPILPAEGNLALSGKSYEFTLTEADVNALVDKGGLAICGNGFTLKNVSLVTADGENAIWEGSAPITWEKGAMMELGISDLDVSDYNTIKGSSFLCAILKMTGRYDWSSVEAGTVVRAQYTVDKTDGCINFGNGDYGSGKWECLPSLLAANGKPAEIIAEEDQEDAKETAVETVEETVEEVTVPEEETKEVYMVTPRQLHDFSSVRWIWIIAAIISFLLPVLNWRRKQQVIE